MISTAGAAIGKIVRSESHVRYTCQIYAPGEVATPPQPVDYAFGSFVGIPLRATVDDATRALLPAPLAANAAPDGLPAAGETWAVGLIYDTILVNPAFGTLGPRLSNDEQVTLFSPDYISERAALVSILLLGTISRQSSGALRVAHGVPALAADLGTEVTGLPDNAVRAFHVFADESGPGGTRAYLHMGYLPHAIAQNHPLLPTAMLQTIERLERLLPENTALLAIVKRNFAWRLKVEATG